VNSTEKFASTTEQLGVNKHIAMLQQIIRQWIYPKELRISQPRADLPCTLNALRAALVEKSTKQATAIETAPYSEDDGPLNAKALAQVGTHLWRLKNKMIEPGLKRPRDEFSRVYRHLDAAWDVLAEAGIEILDLTGRPFDHGQSVPPHLSADCWTGAQNDRGNNHPKHFVARQGDSGWRGHRGSTSRTGTARLKEVCNENDS
jgi:hypothetical protein